MKRKMIKEKKTKTVSVRMSEEDNLYFRIACYQAGTTPSKFLRMMMQSAINAVKVEENKGVLKIEDFQAVLNN